MSVLKIFILEDDVFMAEMLKYHLQLNPDNDVYHYTSGKDLIKALHQEPDMICLDYNLEGENGGEILDKILERNPNLPVVVVSGQEEIEVAVELLHKGAYDYLVKNENVKDRLWSIANRIRSREALEQEVVSLRAEVESKYDFASSIIGESAALKQIFPLIEKACRSSIIVSISGETGTGKEVLAKSIHYNSDRKNKPFVAVNMAAIPSELVESELFGHEKGSFTGAHERRAGKFEEANGGTIFLDEMGDMDLPMQAKLLRVLQEQQVTRVGSNKPIDLNVRVIIATHKNLFEEVSKGNFREDLYYRLLGISVDLPPLRERGNDIVLLARHFIRHYADKNGIQPKKLHPDAVSKLMSHHFPGNIRELKSIIELACVLSEGNEITDADLQIRYGNFTGELLSTEMTLKDYDEYIIRHYLKKYNNRVRFVADKLGIGKSTIYRMLGTTIEREPEEQ
jgi:DNA-binding NtrC family response regulator